MNKIVLLALVCGNICFAGDRIGLQPIQPAQLLLAVGLAEMAVQNQNEVVLNEAKPKQNTRPLPKKVQQKQKFPKHKKIKVHQPRR